MVSPVRTCSGLEYEESGMMGSDDQTGLYTMGEGVSHIQPASWFHA